MKNKNCAVVLFVLSLGLSQAALASFECFTWSQEILFKSVGEDETATSEAVVSGCTENPATNSDECAANLRCFEQRQEVKVPLATF
jgi:hypothetical protein